MPRSFRKDIAVDNTDLLIPHPINAELAGFVSVLHGIDNENVVVDDVQPVKVALDGWGGIKLLERTSTDDTLVLQAQSTNQQVFDIPNDSGTPWFQDMTVQDGWLRIAGGLSYVLTTTTGTFPDTWIGVKVDGRIVGKSPWMTGLAGDDGVDNNCYRSGHLSCSTPVAAGTRRISFVMGVWAVQGSWDVTFTFRTGSWIVRELRR